MHHRHQAAPARSRSRQAKLMTREVHVTTSHAPRLCIMVTLKEAVDWESLRPWLLPSAGTLVAAYLLYKAVRILRTDCDLTLMCKWLKASYFTGRVVWVTGASSGSEYSELAVVTDALCATMARDAHSLPPPLPPLPPLLPPSLPSSSLLQLERLCAMSCLNMEPC